jgi:hypothetical protein
MSSRDREREITDKLVERKSQETVQLFSELIHLRLERYKDALISQGGDMKRGMASEAKSLLKDLDLL